MKNEFGNTNSKDIWENPLLCAQFLRGYTEVSLFEDVQPEDIEDFGEKLRPFVGVEYEGDAVKKIHLHTPDAQAAYVIALFEHKTEVDYDVTFQLLKYMVGIWNIYRNEQNKEEKGRSAQKGFRYPLIVPIVYYEGVDRWTADMHWKDRVEFSGLFGEYVPDFTYRVAGLHSWSREELLSKEEELSLVMLFNRAQTKEDLDISSWAKHDRDIVERILKKAPTAVLRLLAQMVHHLALKLNLPDEEVEKCVKSVEEREMGELWAHMEKMDIQAERRNTQEAREALEKAQAEFREALDQKDQELNQKNQELNRKDQELAALREELARLKQ